MKLHWSSRSPYVRKVMAAAIETGTVESIEPVLSIVMLQTVNDTVLADNPLGKIPTLVTDDGETWYDSLVICEYLNLHRTRASIMPADPVQRLAALRWHALGNGLTDLLVLWNNERNRPATLRSEAHLHAHEAKAGAVLRHLDSTVAQLAGEPLHVGHLAIGAALDYANFRFPTLAWTPRHPSLSAWFQTLAARDSFQRTQHYDPAA